MASTFRFVWDGNVLLHETFKKDNSENTELTTWVFEGFVPTAKLVNGKAYSIISDHLGTPILAVDSDGMEVWNRQLDIYGRVKREIKASSLGDDVCPFIPFLYQGQYYDFETNLAYNRYRYYSPETGAYISQDPIGLASANPTLYGYVKDSNWWVDIFGLDCSENLSNGKNIQQLLDSGKLDDRNGFSKAERALQKHSNRENTVFKKPETGQRAIDYNDKGIETLSSILYNEDSISSNNYGGFDVKDSSNKGARFNNEDIFIGFLEPNRTVL